jgi:pimeloyl-ACP methyl ester carboxylesterase
MTHTASVRTEDADIAYDFEGSGPLLLTVAGGGGDGDRYAGISAILKDRYTVVRYDRRGNSRSTGGRPLDIGQQARDAVAVIRDMGAEQALIFGNSGGGAIAIKIAEDHPEVVSGMIVHEPCTLPTLPDAEDWLDFGDKVEALFREKGTGPAMMLFATSLRGFEGASNEPGHRIGDAQSDRNLDYFMANEFHALSHYLPDMARLKMNDVPMIAARGELSGDVYYARTASVLAESVSCPLRLMSGHHIAFVADPATFAEELNGLLDELRVTVENRTRKGNDGDLR